MSMQITTKRIGQGRRAALGALTALLVLALGTPAIAAGGAQIRLSVRVGPPTTALTVGGRGFGASETVDLDFDHHPVGSTTTDPSGGFSAPLRTPGRALPGPHTVGATGETSGLTASAPFLVRTDWPMARFDPQHTGANPYENVLSPQNVSGLQVGWSFSAPDEGFGTSPAVVEGRVFAGTSGHQVGLYALDAGTGALLWKWTDPLTYVVMSPAVWRGRVYFMTDRGYVYALDAKTGAEAWATSVGGFPTDATVAAATVYVGTGRGYVYALDAETGAVRWATYTHVEVLAAPAVANGVVYAVSDNQLWALDAETGAVLWWASMGGMGNTSSPAVSHGMVYAGGPGWYVYGFSASGCGQASCSYVWRTLTGSGVSSSPAVAYGTVFVGSNDDNIYALDAATGAIRWTTPTGGYLGLASPAVAGGVVYIGGTDDVLRALDASTGEVLWSYTAGAYFHDPSVADGWVYAGSSDTNLYAFHLPP
jgi:outer membrane protein assembly factor BamB